MTVVIIVSTILIVALSRLFYGRNKEIVSAVETLNPEGSIGTALVVYHPGKSDFQRRVFTGFTEGLVSNGWRVEVTTPSAQTPTDLSGYDLLILGGPPTYLRPTGRSNVT